MTQHNAVFITVALLAIVSPGFLAGACDAFSRDDSDPDDAAVRYVNAASATPGVGTSWGSAFTVVQPAVDACAAVVFERGGTCQVWVASGTYPVFQSDEHDTISLPTGVELHGGFAGDETELAQSDPVAHVTTLDGGGQVQHVVTAADQTMLDGFEITGGNAYDSTNWDEEEDEEGTVAENDGFGAGLRHTGGMMVVKACDFHDNSSRRDWSVADGDSSYSDNGGDGGGISSAGSLLVDTCRFASNSGGAIVAQDLTLQNSSFENNRQLGSSWSFCDYVTFDSSSSDTGVGGAVYAVTATVTGCAFVDNVAVNGGAIFAETLFVDDSVFTGNDAQGTREETTETGMDGEETTTMDIGYGGAIDSLEYAEISGSSFSGNTADYGGAVNSRGQILIDSCTFENNSAGLGGAILLDTDSGSGEVSNSVFSANSAQDATAWDEPFTDLASPAGGAIADMGDTLSITNAVLWRNSATSSAALYASAYSSTIRVINTVLSENTADDGVLASSDTAFSYCVFEEALDGEGNIAADPLLVDPDGDDFRLQPGSPCIDAADGDVAPTSDFVGNARVDDPSVVNTGHGSIDYADIGAFEFQP